MLVLVHLCAIYLLNLLRCAAKQLPQLSKHDRELAELDCGWIGLPWLSMAEWRLACVLGLAFFRGHGLAMLG